MITITIRTISTMVRTITKIIAITIEITMSRTRTKQEQEQQ